MIKQDSLIQNRYRIIRLLGSGGFGAVYMAEDLRLGRTVAIKEMDAARLGPDERAVAEQLFEREARMLAALDHPGLTRIWDYFEQERRAYLVMEYVPGQTLRELLRRRGGPLDEDFVLACGIQLCAVLEYLHARRPPVIFRDLKPANVMVVPEEDDDASGQSGEGSPNALAASPARPLARSRFVLIDFGIARLFKPEQAGDTLIIGTPGYAPPEQYGQGQTDARSDIYSLGATLFHLLSGQVPASVPPPPLASANPAVAPDLARAIARATEVDPADRYQTAADFRRDLEALARARAGQPVAVSRGQPTPEHPPRQPERAKTVDLRPARASTLPAPALAQPPRRSLQLAPLVLALIVIGAVVLAGVGLAAFGALPGRSPAARPTPVPRPTAAPAAQDWLLSGAPGKIAFGQRAQSGFDVWAATLDGAPPRQLTADGRSYAPAWSSRGDQIGFTRDENGSVVVYLATRGSSAARRLDLGGMQARYPAWSPDGRRLALAASADGRSWQLAIVDLTTGSVTLVPGATNVGGVAWAPGRFVAFAAQPAAGQPQDIFVLDSSGAPRNVTNTPDVEEDLPSWSPDGKWLAFAASPPGADKLQFRQIFSMAADGGDRTQLTSGPGPHTNPTWSPDGKWIAYVAQENSPDWQVWAMRSDGSAPRQITTSPQRKFYLSWGP